MKRFSVLSPTSGKAFRIGSVIEAAGRHSLDQFSYVWAILNDTFGNNYLQNPPLVLSPDGKWLATNLHLGRDIIKITFIKVTKAGHEFFLRKVSKNEWGAFSSFPEGTENLGSVSINVK